MKKILVFLGLLKKNNKKSDIKPMGVKTIYPDGYIPPQKRVYSDGTIEYAPNIEIQMAIYKEIKKI